MSNSLCLVPWHSEPTWLLPPVMQTEQEGLKANLERSYGPNDEYAALVDKCIDAKVQPCRRLMNTAPLASGRCLVPRSSVEIPKTVP